MIDIVIVIVLLTISYQLNQIKEILEENDKK